MERGDHGPSGVNARKVVVVVNKRVLANVQCTARVVTVAILACNPVTRDPAVPNGLNGANVQ
jgi:hypothetical protein